MGPISQFGVCVIELRSLALPSRGHKALFSDLQVKMLQEAFAVHRLSDGDDGEVCSAQHSCL